MMDGILYLQIIGLMSIAYVLIPSAVINVLRAWVKAKKEAEK